MIRSATYDVYDMTIDERIAKLAERHEALTQSVEILTNDLSELQGLVSQLAEGTEGTSGCKKLTQLGAQASPTISCFRREMELS